MTTFTIFLLLLLLFLTVTLAFVWLAIRRSKMREAEMYAKQYRANQEREARIRENIRQALIEKKSDLN